MIKPTDEMKRAYEVAAAEEFNWIAVRGSRRGLAAVLAIVERDYFPYFCPTSGDIESPTDGGFGVCCDRPDLHCWPPPDGAS